MDISSLLGVLAVFALVAANGFFVAAEFALVKVRVTRIDQLASEGHGTAKVVQKQIQSLDTYIAATQLGITLASLALGWIGEPSLAHLVEPLFGWFGGAAEGVSHSVAVIISFSLITAFHIVLGELVPKAIALQRDESTALFVARPLLIFSRVFRPFILLMNGVGNSVVRFLGLRAASGEHASVHSVEELEMLVAQSRKAGILEYQEEMLLRQVFDFEDKTARQVMIPRSEVIGVPTTISFDELRQILTSERYTRYPVYKDSIDSVIGMVHLKDLVEYITAPGIRKTFDIRQLMRPVLAVPETTSIGTMLTQMQRQRMHLAVVIDEYGTTAGIVTMEDIVEEIVGEVQDEFDTRLEGVRPEVEVLADGTSSVDGLMSLVDFAERFGVKIGAAHAQTIGGYVIEELDRLPQAGDELQLSNYRVRVEEIDHRRVARVKVIPEPQ
ncbi:MAG: HlyC/CorC family transporter [Ktedonobacteraceae bacterium]|nr:HlyC/CorC family transporter [Ktedonobacteraceae bacterium]